MVAVHGNDRAVVWGGVQRGALNNASTASAAQKPCRRMPAKPKAGHAHAGENIAQHLRVLQIKRSERIDDNHPLQAALGMARHIADDRVEPLRLFTVAPITWDDIGMDRKLGQNRRGVMGTSGTRHIRPSKTPAYAAIYNAESTC